MRQKKILALLIASAVLLFFIFDLHRFFSLEHIQHQQQNWRNFYQTSPAMTMLIFFALYVAITALSLPGAAVLTLLAGSLFGLVVGFLIVSFASSLGATLAFLTSRFLLRESVERKFSDFAQRIQRGFEKDGKTYLLSLRLIPAIPFFVVNLAFGLTRMSPLSFYGVSQLGMIPGTVAYVNAGTQLGQVENMRDVLSPSLILSLVMLGLLPLLIRSIQQSLRLRKLYSRYKKPRNFEYNLVVIGAGAAGLVSSYMASAAKAKVALIEKHKMGGDCLNTGCVPSKTLLRTAKFLADVKKSTALGIQKATVDFEFADVMNRVRRVIQTIEPHDSVARYSQLGVECLQGQARVISPWEVEVDGRVLTTKNIVIATGARPWLPPLPGLQEMSPLTSDTLWDLKTRPKRLLVMGGGAIGLELAQAFVRLGSQVTLVERNSRVLPREDAEVSEWLIKKMEPEGLQFHLSTQISHFSHRDQQKVAHCQNQKGHFEILFDEVLVAVGRRANVQGFGLQELGVQLTEQGALQVNDRLQTNVPNIYGCGDVTGRFQFTHVAAQQAWVSTMNALLRPFFSFRNNESLIPWCTYTDPEVARVGLNEDEAQQKKIPYEKTFYNIDHLDRALTEDSAYGFVKILTATQSDHLLGVTLVGPTAGESLAEFVLAMKHGLGLQKILQTIHVYPTMTEANKMAAGQWRKSRLSARALKYSEFFNKWRRSTSL